MTVASWPAGVGYTPLRDGYRRERDDSRARFEPEAGPPKLRRRHSAHATRHTMTLELPIADLQTLHDFYDDDLKDGSLPFTLPNDPVLGDSAVCQFETPISDAPTGYFDAAGEIWRASFVLLRLP